jgi:hypothetical protein
MIWNYLNLIVDINIPWYLLGKTYTLMAPDGIAAGVVDRCFKRIMQDTKHDYKVNIS